MSMSQWCRRNRLSKIPSCSQRRLGQSHLSGLPEPRETFPSWGGLWGPPTRSSAPSDTVVRYHTIKFIPFLTPPLSVMTCLLVYFCLPHYCKLHEGSLSLSFTSLLQMPSMWLVFNEYSLEEINRGASTYSILSTFTHCSGV